MAEHTLTIKAKLDDSDVQNQLNKLEQRRAGGVGGEASKASSEISALGNSIKTLKFIVGSSGLVKSLLDMGKAYKVFGERSDQIGDDIESLGKKIAIGGVTLGAFGVALGAFSSIIDSVTKRVNAGANAQAEAQKKLAEAQERATKEAEKAQKQLYDFKKVFQSLSEYREDREIQRIADRGTDAEQYTQLLKLQGRRNNALQELETLKSVSNPSEATINRAKQVSNLLTTLDSQIDTLKSGRLAAARNRAQNYIDKGDKQGIIDELKSLYTESGDAVQEQINVFTDALKTLNENIDTEAEKERQALFERWRKEGEQTKALDDARKEWQVSEKDYQAAKNGNIEYFKTVMEDAKQGMERSITEQDFRKNRGRYEMARSQIESLSPKVNDFTSLMQMFAGGSTSGFNSLGFGMGETFQTTDTIERQIDQIIRLMQEQISRQLQYVNQSTTL